MRSFLGIDVPQSIRTKCIEIQKKIKNTGADIKLVEKDNLHWTVKFLGEINSKETEKLKELVHSITSKVTPIEIVANGLGVFPNTSYIKTIWMGISKNKGQFTSIIKRINDKLEENGFRKEGHDIKPHLTLARVKSGRNKGELKSMLHNMNNVKVGKMKINSITLYRSELKSEGPIYRKINNFKLGE